MNSSGCLVFTQIASFPYCSRAHFAHLLIVALNKHNRYLKVQSFKMGVRGIPGTV
jgi:hypothetical protein